MASSKTGRCVAVTKGTGGHVVYLELRLGKKPVLTWMPAITVPDRMKRTNARGTVDYEWPEDGRLIIKEWIDK